MKWIKPGVVPVETKNALKHAFSKQDFGFAEAQSGNYPSPQKGRGTKSLIHPMGEVAWVDPTADPREAD
jgi:hypothetical protein